MTYGEKKLFVPVQDDFSAPIAATERALGELPLEDCELVRNEVGDNLQFVAPPGKIFRVQADRFSESRIKPLYVSRSEADGEIPNDPLSFRTGVYEAQPEDGEYLAKSITIQTGHRMLGSKRYWIDGEDGWTQHPNFVSSDDVEVKLVLFDDPQAWTVHGVTSYTWKDSDSDLALSNPLLVHNAQGVFYASRQGYLTTDFDKAKVELVDIDYDKLAPDDGVARSPDGRVLQIAGSPDSKPEGKELRIVSREEDAGTALEHDEYRMDIDDKYRYYYGKLPQEERIKMLWRSRRKYIGGDEGHNLRTPFGDDPLATFEIVLAKEATGKVPDMDELLHYMEETARLSAMSYTEIMEEKDKPPTREAYERTARDYFEVIPGCGSVAVAVATHCGEGWQLSAGQRKFNQSFFGVCDSPAKTWELAKDLSSMSVGEAVAKFATEDWLIQDIANHRRTAVPRRGDMQIVAEIEEREKRRLQGL